MSVTTGCIRCGIRLYCESSTFLGSIKIILTSSGRLVIRIERIMAFKQTDLPVPVRPAIKRCGMSARSKTSGLALDVLAEEQRDAAFLGPPGDAGHHVAQPDHVAVVVGHLDADGRLAGNRRHDADARHRQGDRQVVGQAHDLRDPQPGLELDLELGDHRAGIDLHDADLIAEIEQGSLQQHGPGMDLGLVLLNRERRRGLEHFHRW